MHFVALPQLTLAGYLQAKAFKSALFWRHKSFEIDHCEQVILPPLFGNLTSVPVNYKIDLGE
jgi:hypothetical protein